jgi:hypothetical protein
VSGTDFERPESGTAVFEPKSRVKVSSNAKGEAQVEVSAVEGTAAGELARLREAAVGEYLAAMRALRPTAVPA